MELKSSIENVDDVTRKLKVTIPVDRVTREFNDALAEMTKTSRLKGFRPGKAPRQLVEKMHGERVRLEVANRLINTSLSELVKKHELDMVGRPEIDLASFEPGKEIEYTAQISLFPKPEIKGYDKFKLKLPKRETTDADVEGVVKRMLESKATLRKLEFRNAVQTGDVIDATVVVSSGDGSAERPEPLVVAVGEGRIPAELDQGLVGMEVGTSKEISVAAKEPAEGQEAQPATNYKVTLNSISERVLPEMTDDFAKEIDAETQTVLELRMKIRTKLDEERVRSAKSDMQAAILEELVKHNEFSVPQILVDDEIRSLLVRNGFVKQDKIHALPVDGFRESLGEVATKRVRTSIAVDRIAELEKIKPEEADIDSALKDMADQNGVSKEELVKFLSKEKLLGNILMEITRNKVLEFLEKRSTAEYVPESELKKEQEASGADSPAAKGKKAKDNKKETKAK